MGHGLRHPGDLVAWRRWHEGRHPVRGAARSARQRLRPPAPSYVDLLTPQGESQVLIAVEATHASVDRAVVAPLAYLPAEQTSIVAPVGWQTPAAYVAHTRRAVPLAELTTYLAPRAVLAAGHYTEIGAAAFALAEGLDIPFFVSQHGALTPFAPPLPRAAHLLAWNEADAAFWTYGRADVTVTITGSQLLWEAGAGEPGPSHLAAEGGPLIYLGQGHAAEISRSRLFHAAMSACRARGAVYRPHPSEQDFTSRLALAAYRRAGIVVDTSPVALVDLDGPILSVFSTGVLEAAARGRDAWVDFPLPPAWLGEFWERYGMSRYGSPPTPPPPRSAIRPARLVADALAAGAM